MKNPSCVKYYRYDELTDILRQYEKEYPDIVKMESIGKSYGGRDIWVMKVTDFSTGCDLEKPAYYVDGNVHSFEVSASATCLYILHYLVENYKKEKLVTEAIDTRVFYIIPRIDPDGAEWALADRPKLVRSSIRPHPYDEEPLTGLLEEDLDGDGRILYMRIKDHNGLWKKHPDYPDLMIRRDPIEHDGEYYRIVPEGMIANYDGSTIDVRSIFGLINWPNGPWPKEAIDIDKNYPRRWAKMTKPGVSAGSYPTSEPESRAIVEFIIGHPNISQIAMFHTIGKVMYRPSDDLPDSMMYEEDMRVFNLTGEKGTEFTGYPHQSFYEGLHAPEEDWDYYPGDSVMWVYEELGIYSWMVELWQPLSMIPRDKPYVHHEWFKDHTPEEDVEIYKWAKENFGNNSYVEWREFDHPQLGKVEIGGWDWMWTWLNPPLECLEKEIEGFPKWVVWNSLITPKLEIRDAAVTDLGGDNYKVRLVVENTGYMSTYASRMALKQNIRGVVAEIGIPDGASFIRGMEREEIGQLMGRSAKDAMVNPRQGSTDDRALVEWIIHAPKGGTVKLLARHERAGTVRTELELK